MAADGETNCLNLLQRIVFSLHSISLQSCSRTSMTFPIFCIGLINRKVEKKSRGKFSVCFFFFLSVLFVGTLPDAFGKPDLFHTCLSEDHVTHISGHSFNALSVKMSTFNIIIAQPHALYRKSSLYHTERKLCSMF